MFGIGSTAARNNMAGWGEKIIIADPKGLTNVIDSLSGIKYGLPDGIFDAGIIFIDPDLPANSEEKLSRRKTYNEFLRATKSGLITGAENTASGDAAENYRMQIRYSTEKSKNL